ncbi:MAG: hypothetical protein U0900_08000 [Myxococcota bacterium]
MQRFAGRLFVLVSALLLLTACGRDDSKSTSEGSASSGSPAAEPAPPAAPDAGSAAEPAAPDAAPADAAQAEDPEAAARRLAVEFALAEQRIAEDPKGQWATTAEASSSFGDAVDQRSYSAWQATGAPNVERYSDDGNSWASKDADKGIEWLEVGFAKPVHAEAIRIRQSYAPGAIIKIELVDEAGAKQAVFDGLDTPPATGAITWFERSFEKTSAPVAKARITLATNAVPGWNEVDAVQLVGE